MIKSVIERYIIKTLNDIEQLVEGINTPVGSPIEVAQAQVTNKENTRKVGKKIFILNLLKGL